MTFNPIFTSEIIPVIGILIVFETAPPDTSAPAPSGIGNEVEFVNLCKGIHTSDILGSLKPITHV